MQELWARADANPSNGIDPAIRATAERLRTFDAAAVELLRQGLHLGRKRSEASAFALSLFGSGACPAESELEAATEAGEVWPIVALGACADTRSILVLERLGRRGDEAALRALSATDVGTRALAALVGDPSISDIASVTIEQAFAAAPETRGAALPIFRERLRQRERIIPVLRVLASFGPTASELIPDIREIRSDGDIASRDAALAALCAVGDSATTLRELATYVCSGESWKREYGYKLGARLGNKADPLLSSCGEKEPHRSWEEDLQFEDFLASVRTHQALRQLIRLRESRSWLVASHAEDLLDAIGVDVSTEEEGPCLWCAGRKRVYRFGKTGCGPKADSWLVRWNDRNMRVVRLKSDATLDGQVERRMSDDRPSVVIHTAGDHMYDLEIPGVLEGAAIDSAGFLVVVTDSAVIVETSAGIPSPAECKRE